MTTHLDAFVTPERPITGPHQDELERHAFIDRFVEAVVNRRTRRATGVVLGVTGPWGSGKSSVLNLLAHRLTSLYPNIVLVRFDPWLVSGRDELIQLFLREFFATLDAKSNEGAEWSRAATALADYAEALAATARNTNSLLGNGFSFFSWWLKRVLRRDTTIEGLRGALKLRLADVRAPIVVLIDELDRIEDSEVRSIAQLVRAVVDFSGISYVLAYDFERVTEALGHAAGLPRRAAKERGRDYLEKIVQFSVSLPIAEGATLRRLLDAELRHLRIERLDGDPRTGRVMSMLIGSVITTPRDVKRVAGQLLILESMTRGEIHVADLLGYAALTAKAPGVVENIRQNPERYVDDPISEDEQILRSVSPEKRTVVFGNNTPAPIKLLVNALFPATTPTSRSQSNHPLSISKRYALMSVLRLGLAPGQLPRAMLEQLFIANPDQTAAALADAVRAGTLSEYVDRISDLYPLQEPLSTFGFWIGVGHFITIDFGSDIDFLTQRGAVSSFARILLSAAARAPERKSSTRDVLYRLADAGEINLLSEITRLHFFMFGMFGRRQDGDTAAIMSEDEVKIFAQKLAKAWRRRIFQNRILDDLRNADVFHILKEMGLWSASLKKKMRSTIHNDPTAIDKISLLFYGGNHMVENRYIDNLFGRDIMVKEAQRRLSELGVGLGDEFDEFSNIEDHPSASLILSLRRNVRGLLDGREL